MAEQIEQYMRTLKLGGLAKNWRSVQYISTEQYLTELLKIELHEREVNRINRMVKTAGFRVMKTLDDFVWNSSIELPHDLTREYMTELSFLQPKENLIFMGAVGTGKTHLATAIALKACQEGRRVRFFTAAELANILLERNTKGTLNNFLNTLKKVELIVIDEIGFVPLHKDAAELLFQVISDCYERKSLIITSNLEPQNEEGGVTDMAKKINFKSEVSSELRAYLQKEYEEYAAKTSMTEEEHKDLRSWIAEGNSPYGNPSLYADERGVEMDFISGSRIAEDLKPKP